MSETKLDYKLQYEEFIQEKGLDVKKFPPALGKKLRTMKMIVGKFESNPSDAWKQKVISEDIATANLIADWVERDYPDDIIDPNPTPEDFEVESPASPEGENTPPVAPEGGNTPPAAPEGGNTPPAAPEGENTPPVAPEGGNTPPAAPEGGNTPPAAPEGENTPPAEQPSDAAVIILEMEKKIMENKKGNRIKTKTLASIINQEPDYPVQVVGKLKLKKVFLSNEYEII